MNRLTRSIAAVAVASVVVPLWSVPAYAETGTESASSGAYFSSTGIAKPDAAPAAPPNVTAQADGVAPGNLAVAARGGEWDKVSFLFFSLSNVPFESTITKATLTVPLAPSDQENVHIAAAPAKVRACKNGAEGFGGEDGAAMSLAPSVMCEEFAAPAQASTDGAAYVFDITSLAASWMEANDGVALVPAEGADSTNFQVVFKSADQAQLAYEYSPPAGSDDTGTDTSTDLGGDFGGTDFGTGSTELGGFDAGTSTDFTGGVGSVDAPLMAESLAEPVTDEAAEEPVIAAVEASSGGPVEAASPTASFWLAAVVLAGMLALVSLVMGDAKVRTAAAAVPTPLTRALTERSRRPSLLN